MRPDSVMMPAGADPTVRAGAAGRAPRTRRRPGTAAPGTAAGITDRPLRRGQAISILLAAVLLLAGAGLLAYTPVSDWFHARRVERRIAAYEQAVAGMSAAEREERLAAALAYNAALPTGTHFFLTEEQTAAYAAQLDPTGTGMMGYIEIPKIKVRLPVCHTVEKAVLAESAGHIPGSSLPVGGERCHTVICAHRDLPSAYLFRRLGELKAGDRFTLTVLGRTVTYEVDEIRAVLPKDTSALAIEDGHDRCTLVSCHPYGSKSQRLLVRGKRVA